MDVQKAHKYCFVCGDTYITNERPLKCDKCGHIEYINPSSCVVVGFINSAKELLLIKRNIEPHADTWDLPGGFVELNESFEQAAQREMQEELNLKINISELIYINSAPDNYLYSGVVYCTLGIGFAYSLSEKEIDQIHAQDDAKEFKFFAYNDIPLNEIKFPSVVNGIKQIKSKGFLD